MFHLKPPQIEVVFLYLCHMEKEHQIFGIRAIIEAIQSGTEIDKVFLQKDAQGDLMKELLTTMKKTTSIFLMFQ